MTKFALDTQLYIQAFRNPDSGEVLRQFYREHTPKTHLSSVVLHELAIGGTSEESAGWAEKVGRQLKRLTRIITPSHDAWRNAGTVLSRLAKERGIELRRRPRSLVNDVLIAASCREAGVTLVTANTRDFEMIRRVLPFDFVPPWP